MKRYLRLGLSGFNPSVRLLGVGFFWFLAIGLAAAAAPEITKITVLPTRQLELQLSIEKGQNYVFEISTNLVDWAAVGGIENAPIDRLTVVDEKVVDRSPVRFYRMRVGRYQRFTFQLLHFAVAGQFLGSSATPVVTYPVLYNGYSAAFEAEGDAPYPPKSEIFFTGPAGSGLSSSPASYSNENDSGTWYQSPQVNTASGAPTGTWSVNYRGTNMTFTTDLAPLTRLVVPVPTVEVSDGQIRSVTWAYRDRMTGQILSAPPAYMQSVQVQIEGLAGRLYESDRDGAPAVTGHVLNAPVSWSDVRQINVAYDDFSNHYVVSFWIP